MKKIILYCFMLALMSSAWGVELQLIPMPRQLESSGVKVYLPGAVSVVTPSGYETEAVQLSQTIGQAGLKIQPQAVFTFKLVSRQDQGNTAITRQSYSINVTDSDCTITAGNADGAFYGIQMLKQLLQRDDKGIFIYKLKIEDSPALAMRGVVLDLRWVTANQQSIDALKNLFAAMAAFKINALFLEFSDNIKYVSRSFPKKEASAFTPAQVTDLVDYAKSLHMEVIPYIPTLSHSAWIMSNPDNVKLLEDPANSSWSGALCPNKPETQAFLKDIVKETIAIFKPNYFHIGCDEVSWCPYRNCDVCKKQAITEPLKKHILFMYSLLKESNVKTIVYHDEFMSSHYNDSGATPGSKTNGWEIVDQLPKDIVINLWLYDWIIAGDKEQVNSKFKYFSDKGFQIIAASFDDASNTQMMPEVLSGYPNALGIVMTYWYKAGNWAEENISPQALSMTTLLGAYGWNPTNPPLDKITYDTVYAISQNWLSNNKPSSASLIRRPLAIPYNCRIGLDWPVLRNGDTVKPLPSQLNAGPVVFQMGPPSENNLLAVSGDNGDGFPVSQVSFPVNLAAEKLSFLHACGIPDNIIALELLFGNIEKPIIGEYIVEYADQIKISIPLRFRGNITSWNSKLSPLHGQYAYADATSQGNRFMLTAYEWENPWPQKIIKTITLKSLFYNRTPIALLALTAQCQPRYNFLWEDFSDNSVDSILKRWKLSCFTSGGQVKSELLSQDGARVLRLTVPGGIKHDLERIILDREISSDVKIAGKILSLPVYLEGKAITMGLFFGDSDTFDNYGVTYQTLSPGMNKIRLSAESLTPEQGKLEIKNIKILRVAFFMKNPDQIKLSIGNMRWLDGDQDIPYNNNVWYK